MSNKQLLPPFEAYKGQEPYIFISYSHKDSIFVFPEIKRLSDLGYRIWYDEGIDPGNEWPEEIAKALNLSSFFVVFISSNAVNSKNVKNEINFALNKSKPFLAIHIEDISLPVGLELRMGDIQAILKYRMIDSMYDRKIDKVLPINLKLLPNIESFTKDNDLLENNYNPRKLITVNTTTERRDADQDIVSNKTIPEINENDKHHSGYLNQFKKLETGLYSDVLYFDDKGYNFRNDEKAWSDLLYEKSEVRNIAQVILKTVYPLGHGKLFRNLTRDFSTKLTIITSINEIRKEDEDVLISKGVSWEQTALDLVSELKNNKSISQLLYCKRLIVNFQSEGALYIEMDDMGDIAKCRLIFDSQSIEDEWWKNIEKGFYDKPNLPVTVDTDLMSYYTSSIVHSFKDKKQYEINLETSISEALSIFRKSKLSWYLDNVTKTKFSPESFHNEIDSKIKSQFASAFVPIPFNNQSTKDYRQQSWTILEGNYKPSNGIRPEPLFDTSFRFALYGECELVNTPCLKIGDFLTYDRHEIEELRNTTNQIDNYLKNDNGEKPFSLAVFGSPGSDKLFLVKQLAQHFELPLLDFNLSQISDDGLIEVFDQVADLTLNGKVPIVYLDEFDCNEYKWIQQLLISMQSGKYNDGRRLRPVRKSVFIFSTSTSFTFWSFGIEKPKEPFTNNITELKNYEIRLNSYNNFILKKGPDFKRLISACFLHILGPNQMEMLDEFSEIKKDSYGKVIYNKEDIHYPVRRALVIRILCNKRGNDILNIDYGLLNALIKSRYYGPDSLEKILSHLKTKNSDKLRKSNLPATSNLNMLVSADFIPLMEEDKFIEFEAFKIAPQIHNNWIKIGDKQGWKMEYHKDYNFLPVHMKDEHIAEARRIQRVLDSLRPELNLRIVTKDEAEFYERAEFDKTIADPELIERMAIEEHYGWMKTKESTGWVFGMTRNDDKKIHYSLIGWDEEITLEDGTKLMLSERERMKERDFIKQYSDVLKSAGFVIVKGRL